VAGSYWRGGRWELLKETIEAGLKLKTVKPSRLARINVDTTVQEKDALVAKEPAGRTAI